MGCNIGVKVEYREHTDEKGTWLITVDEGFKLFLDKGGELVEGERAADADMGEHLMLVKFQLTGVPGDVVWVCSHATVDIDGITVEGPVGGDAEPVGELVDEGAVTIHHREFSCFEAPEETVKLDDTRENNEFRSPGML